MALITHEEILRVARMSHIELTEQEIVQMQSHIEAVLSYAARVQHYAQEDISARVDDSFLLSKNSNVEREDVVIKPCPDALLQQAPEREGDYFVVPVIIETTE